MIKEQILKWIEPFVNPSITGFDISDRSIKYVKLEGMDRIGIDFFGELEIPEGLIEHGEIKQEDGLTELLKAWRIKEGRRVTHIVGSLPEEKSFLRVIQLPRIKQENIYQAIRWELEANVPFPADQLIYDHEIIEPIEDHLTHLDVVITAFPKAIIESYVRVLKKTGFRLCALELESQATIRSVIKDIYARNAYVVIDTGRNRTSFIIFAGGTIRFTTTIPLGGKIFEENIMKALGVDQEKALELKKLVGLDRRAENGRIFSALLPALSAFADELHRAIFFYQDHATHTHGAESVISAVLLSGGDASLLGFDTYLSSALKIPVMRANPFARVAGALKEPIPPLAPNIALSFTTAIGLALRTFSSHTANPN